MTYVMIALFSLALLRVLYLIRHSVMDGIGHVILFPFTLADDIRRNGRDVLKAAFWWLVAIVAIASLTLLF
jgi:hypothetical protein